MAKTYYCPYATARRGRVPVDCKALESKRSDHAYVPCAFQRYCAKLGKSVLTQQALGCLERKRMDREERKHERKSEKEL